MLTNPLRDASASSRAPEFYTAQELARIVTRSAELMGAYIEAGGAGDRPRARHTTDRQPPAAARARLCRGQGDGSITREMADAALSMLDVDRAGFDLMDRKLLEAVLHKFGGGPVGVDNLAAAIGEERDTIEDVLEPYLIQQGYLQRTPRGRWWRRPAPTATSAWPHPTLAARRRTTRPAPSECRHAGRPRPMPLRIASHIPATFPATSPTGFAAPRQT